MTGYKWQGKDLDAREVYALIKEWGALTTKELKESFGTDSASVRVACGKLMAHNKVFPFGAQRGTVWYMITDGRKGTPNPSRRRAEAGHPLKSNSGPRATKEGKGVPSSLANLDQKKLARLRAKSSKRARMTADLPEDDY